MASELTTWHYFVGDIHGCFDEYKQLEEKILRHAKKNEVNPLIISVGDMVDRGPDSAGVVRHFCEGAAAGTHLALMGNHEAFLLATLWTFAPWGDDESAFPEALRSLPQRHDLGLGAARVLPWDDYRQYYRMMWLIQGGYETLTSFGCDPHKSEEWTLAPEDLHFLRQLPLLWENEHFVVTHALADMHELAHVRDWEPRYQDESDEDWEVRRSMYQDACYQLLWRREAPERPPAPGRTHISGHTVFSKVTRHKRLQTIQIDTGCVYGGRLTAWCGESNTFFRVRAKE